MFICSRLIVDVAAHINILRADTNEGRLKKIAALQAIYRKQGLPHAQIASSQAVDLSKFQPTFKELNNRQ